MTATDEIENSNSGSDTTDATEHVDQPSTPSTSNVEVDTKLDEMFEKMNSKIDEISKTYNTKIDDLTSQIKQKDDELVKLKNVNAQILLNSSYGNKSDNTVDFASAEFDDIDWNREAKSYMDSLDSRIFS